MYLSLNKAAKEAAISKSTLSEALNSGRLSANKDDRGRWQIDPSELFRVFPKTTPNEHVEPTQNPRNERANSDLERELEALRKEIDTANLERERERAQLSETITDLRTRLDRESEERRALTAMITDQRSQTKPTGGFLGMFRGRQ